MSHSQINALITLIEDPDPQIFSHIRTWGFHVYWDESERGTVAIVLAVASLCH